MELRSNGTLWGKKYLQFPHTHSKAHGLNYLLLKELSI